MKVETKSSFTVYNNKKKFGQKNKNKNASKHV